MLAFSLARLPSHHTRLVLNRGKLSQEHISCSLNSLPHGHPKITFLTCTITASHIPTGPTGLQNNMSKWILSRNDDINIRS
jgi:hypothetical protein